jgi:hypothetical protein
MKGLRCNGRATWTERTKNGHPGGRNLLENCHLEDREK